MKIPSQLSFRKSIHPTYGMFYYLMDGKKHPIPLKKIAIRGLKSSYKEGRESKAKSNPHTLAQSNIVEGDFCMVPGHVDEIYCDFSLRISANTFRPEVCNCSTTQEALLSFLKDYAEADGYSVIARRYAKNLLMGTWLFRNNEKEPAVNIKTNSGKSFTVKNSALLDWGEENWKQAELTTLNKLTEEIEMALTNKSVYWQAKVSATLPVAPCEEIFPSQVMDTKNKDKQLVSVWFDHEKETAALTDKKIGAGIARIDDWYSDEANFPVRATEYGGDKSVGVALRHPDDETDFYSIFENFDKHKQALQESKSVEAIPQSLHYFVSVLVKGGLFMKESDEKKEKKASKKE